MYHRLVRSLPILEEYFGRLLREDPDTGALYIYDEELDGLASCCTTGEVACFYLMNWKINGGEGRSIANRLVEYVHKHQLENGGFGQPYYVKKGESSTIDIAEIGAVANSLYHIYQETRNSFAKESLLKTANYLLTQVAEENPGAVYKNPNAMMHDVINGDIYAAHTWGRAYQMTQKEIYRKKVEDVIHHVTERFSQHDEGWWPYTEDWNGNVGMGNSVSYQGTILAFADTCIPILSQELKNKWMDVQERAMATMLQALKEGPNDSNEAPWWCRDWDNAWEIYLALWRNKEHPEAKLLLEKRLDRLNDAVQVSGISVFTPKVAVQDPERTPVTTTFRKAATFAGIISYMILDDAEKNNI